MAKAKLIRACTWLLLMSSLAGMPALADEPQHAAGQRLYADYCAQCHGADRRGLEVFSKDLAAFTLVLSGMTKDMPDFTDFFSDEETAVLYVYLAAPK